MPFPIMAAAIGAGALTGYLGQKETNSANQWAQRDANEANWMMSRENRDWQQLMSNTAHLREVQDLKNAGLNPILSAGGGSGASTPSGNVATMNAARMEDALGKSTSSALASANLTKDLQMADSQKALNASAIDTQNSQQDVNTSSAQKLRMDSIKTAQETGVRETSLATMRAAAEQQAQADLKKATMDNKMATYDAIQTRTKAAFETAGSAKDAINPFKGLLGPGKNIPPSGEIFKNRNGESGFYDKAGKYNRSN